MSNKLNEYKWEIKQKLNKDSSLNDLIESLLKSRGIEDINEFLNVENPLKYIKKNKNFSDLYKNAKKAADLIEQFINANKPIVIHGDYDVDGITATAILWRTIYYDLGYKNVFVYIPNRFDEGYGLTKDSLGGIQELLKEKGFADLRSANPLLITVDCGIVSTNEVEQAKSLGFTVIITDHHQKDKEVPKANVIVHTTKATGAGISWVISNLLLNKDSRTRDSSEIESPLNKNSGREETETSKPENNEPNPPKLKYTDLAALGTICDLQPLTEFNRTIAKHGIAELNKQENPGIKKLSEEAGIEKVDTYEIGWVLGPRLNATGRLETALESLRLLCTNSDMQAQEIAITLSETNKIRQEMTLENYELALEEFRQKFGDINKSSDITDTKDESDKTFDSAGESANKSSKKNGKVPPILITASEKYHKGIIGLVAGKLTQTYYRPSIVIAIDKASGEGKGSCRSIEGISIIEVLRRFEDLFLTVGGHDMAAGFSLPIENIEKLKSKIAELENEWEDEIFSRKLKIDAEIPHNLISKEAFYKISKLKPFGIGNKEPVFVTRNFRVFNMSRFGRENSHLKLFLTDENDNKYTALAFKKGNLATRINLGDKIDIAYTLTINKWNGYENLELRVVDVMM